jgi:[acyl-carrier-protein] S-malonyltransferase
VGKLAFLFPGQGSVAVGMGEAIAEASPGARKVLDQLAELRPDLRALCSSGPIEELIRTANAQPTIFAVDCACLEALQERGVRPDLVAGHSLGEYAALVAADVVDFATALGLVIERGKLMEEAARAQPGTMLAVMGLDPERVAGLVAAWQSECASRARGVIANANDNAPGQVVISGDAATLAAAADDFRAAGGRVRELPVGGAFHSALMQSAADAFVAMLDRTPFAEARVPVVPNLTATASRDAGDLKAALRAQITGSVRWRESIDALVAAGSETFVEVGPGTVLSGLARRCTRGRAVRILNVEDSASLEATLRALEPAGATDRRAGSG